MPNCQFWKQLICILWVYTRKCPLNFSRITNLESLYYKLMRWYLWAWKLCLTITVMQHNASVTRQFFSLKNTYDVLKITTHYLVLNMHSDVMKRIILKQLHFAFPQHLWSWYYFLYFTERRLALCGRDRKRESWDSSLERETLGLPMPLYFKVVDIINDYQVESHYINWFFYTAFPSSFLKWWTAPICPTTIMWPNRQLLW